LAGVFRRRPALLVELTSGSTARASEGDHLEHVPAF